NFLSEKESFTRNFFRYGYGQPGWGLLSFSLNAKLVNPWIRPQSSEDLAEYQELRESSRSLQNALSYTYSSNTNGSILTLPSLNYTSPCSTITEYFTCRQKYFELYINLLRKKDKHNPHSGFGIKAFEQSERARTRSLQILHNLNDASELYEEPSSQQKWLLERKIRLSQPKAFQEIQKKSTDDNTLLIEYFLGDEASYMWVVSPDGSLQTFELQSRSIIESKAIEFYSLLTEPIGRVQPEKTAEVGKELSSMLLGPIEEQLNHQRLAIVADGFLQYLPFSALPNPASNDGQSLETLEGEFAKRYSPLILEHEVISLPSASSLVSLRETRINRPISERELTLFSDPVFNHRDKRFRSLKLGNGDFELFQFDHLRSVDTLYGALPNTIHELSKVDNIEILIPAHQRQDFSGFQASLDNALSPDLGRSRIVHFASHGIFNTSAPQRSGMILSSFNEEGELQPGLLSPAYAFDKMNLLATDLVVLSGCRTGITGNSITREGITGFTGGLMAAGADRVVASLWSVEDEATRELMGKFYTNLLDKNSQMTASEALRAAQIEMWNDPQWQTPYNWAAFILQGEWE
ncbi:MAG: CHAT domain-containing protein, partial [Leptolyngbya sp. SIO4C1]|nr:CHAT domain-containing protein [Leptolyngbya sp. SIO4C1]